MTSSPSSPTAPNAPSEAKSPLVTNRRVATAIVIGLTLLSGVVHGYLDGRWSTNENMVQRGSKLAKLPQQIGDWTLSQASELDPKAAAMLQCYGSTVRVYQNERTGATVNVAIMFGPRGPIAVHTPEVCYSSVGTKQLGNRRLESIDVDGHEHSLWSVRFAVDSSPNPTLEVWYGWSTGEAWEARDQPRFWLTDSLYKIQVAGPAGNDTHQPVKDFLKAFLPLAQKVMP